METTSRNGAWIRTVSGRKFWPNDPRPEDVNIHDIAHALSNQCRWSGHSDQFYSVAQHSALVFDVIARRYPVFVEMQAAALLHDAAEAYVIDVPHPVKRQPEMEWYRHMERRVTDAVSERFGIPRTSSRTTRSRTPTAY